MKEWCLLGAPSRHLRPRVQWWVRPTRSPQLSTSTERPTVQLTGEQLEAVGYVSNNIASAFLEVPAASDLDRQSIHPRCPLCGEPGGKKTGELRITAKGELALAGRVPVVALHRVHAACLETTPP